MIVKFENLDKLKANDWKEEMKQVNKRAPGKKLKNKVIYQLKSCF